MGLYIPFNLDILLIALIINSALAFWVYRHDSKSATNVLFILLSFVMSGWLIANYISISPTFLSHSLFLIRTTIAGATALTFLFFLLAHTIPSKKILLQKNILLALIATTLGIIVLNMSPYAFTGVEIIDASPNPQAGPGILPFGIFSSAMVLSAIVILVRKTRKAVGAEKKQLLLILSGIVLMSGAIILTIFLPVVLSSSNTFVGLMPAYTLFFLAATAYAIVRHRMFSVRVIATELFTVLTISVFLINLFLSTGVQDAILNGILLVLSGVFGVLVIRGTLREIKALQDLSDAKSEFVSIASHQLRTPLTAIKGYISMIMEGTYGEISTSQNEALSKVYASNERLMRLVDDLLNVSRIEQGRLTYTYAETSVSKMIESIISELQISAKFKNIELNWKNPENSEKFIIWADAMKLRQSVLNLIDNAIKYTEKGSVNIRLEQNINPSSMRISVRDTGVGLSLEDKAKIFKRFSRGSGSSKLNAGGSGLGLFVAKKIVEDHKGHIWAESEGRDKGSTFIITLPFYRQKTVGKKSV